MIQNVKYPVTTFHPDWSISNSLLYSKVWYVAANCFALAFLSLVLTADATQMCCRPF